MATTEVDKSSDRVKEMFGQIAPQYDRMNHLLSLNIDHFWRWWTARKLKPEADGPPILDLCSGTGDLAIAFYKRTAGKTPIMAADFCAEMLSLGRQKVEKLGAAEQVTFLEADTEALPFDDDLFQIVSVAFGIRNVSDTQQGLREMLRVCQPGGKIAVLEFSSPRWQPFKGMYLFYFKHILPRIGQWFARNDKSAYHYLPQSVAEFPSGKEFAAMMEEVGIKNVRFHALTLGVATLYIGQK